MTDVINALSDYEINCSIKWYEDYCVVSLDKVDRKDWSGILEEIFESIYEDM